MSFPQPSSEAYTTASGQFFRLNTPLACPGDMYESLVSGLGMALGPQSDIANVNIAYWDGQVPNFMQFAQINQDRAFVGRLDANNDSTFTPANRPGRVLIWPGDLYDPNYRPRAFGGTDTIQFATPVLDVIQYFGGQPSLTPGRVDKTYLFQNYVITGTLYIVIPYYGRKYCYVNFTNREAIASNTFGIMGVNFAITNDQTPSQAYHQETVIRAAAAVLPGAAVTQRITAGSNGMFDVLVFSVTSAGPAPLKIVVSDDSQGT
jgi:hypothetical protein